MGLLVKLLGVVDLAAAAALLLASSGLLPVRVVVMVAAMLSLKGFGFLGDPVSVFDIILGCYLLFTLLYNIQLLSVLFAIYLGFKGIYSMF